MAKRITKRVIDRLKPGEMISSTDPTGFVARRLPSGVVTYGFRYRAAGRQHWIGLGLHGDLTVDQARIKALQLAKDIRHDRRPLSAREEATEKRAAGSNIVNNVLDKFLERYAKPKLRSADEIERIFRVYVRPRLGNRSIYEVRRRDITQLLDEIEDRNGPVQADRVLAHLRKALGWQAARVDDFVPPIVKGMARAKPAAERARTRVLDDQEIRDLWAALDRLGDKAPACYPPLVRMLLLTGQRRENVATMRWEEVVDGDTWVIPPAKFKTGAEQAVPLSSMAKALLGPPQASGFVFSSDGGARAFGGFSKSKKALDAELDIPDWCHHDLRRSCRSLLSRAGVDPDTGERVLGHVIPGVRRTYDRFSYLGEKRSALEKLAALVERILQPGEAVVRFPAKSRGALATIAAAR